GGGEGGSRGGEGGGVGAGVDGIAGGGGQVGAVLDIARADRHLRIAWLWDARGGRAECKLLLAEIILSLGRHHVAQSGSRHDEQNTQADGVRRSALSHALRGSGSGAEKRDEFTPYHCLTPPVLPTERIAHLRRQEAAALRHLNVAHVRFGSVTTEAVGVPPQCMSASRQKRPSPIQMLS